jgi:hypothetical protein
MIAERPSARAFVSPAWGSSEQASPSERLVVHAVAVDVSEQGMKLQFVGAPLRAVLEASDPLVQIEVVFTHPDLRSIGPAAGHAQWRLAGGDGDTWGLGVRFDAAFKPHEMSRILRVGRTDSYKESWAPGTLPVLVFGLASALLGIGWYRSHSAAAAERGLLERRISIAEDALSVLKGAEERCFADLNARPRPEAVAPPKATAEPSAPAVENAPAALETAKPDQAPALDLQSALPAPSEPHAGLPPIADATDARSTSSGADAAVED